MAETSVKKFLDVAGLQHIIEKLYARGFNGMGLSQENFTSALLAKLNSTATTEGMSELNTRLSALEALIETDKDGAINKFNEIVAFLNGVEDTKTLEGILSAKANSADVYTRAEADGKFATPAAVDTKLEPYAKSADFDTALSKKANSADVAAEMEGKVDKVDGKGLSANDYTDTDKAAVGTIGDKLNAADISAITNTEIDAILSE